LWNKIINFIFIMKAFFIGWGKLPTNFQRQFRKNLVIKVGSSKT